MAAVQSPISNSHISGSYARALLRAVTDQGYDARQFAEEEGVTLEVLQSCEELPAQLFGRLYQRAMLLLKDESLGMVSGGRVATGTFRMMCLCVIHRPDLRTVIERAGEFLDICKGMAIKPCIIPACDSVAVGFGAVSDGSERTLQQILDADGPMRVRTSLFMWYNLLSWFAGRSLPLKRVEFTFDKPANGEHWSSLFRCPVAFACEQSLLRFEKSALDLPNVQTEQSLSVFLKSAPYRLIVPSYHDQRLSDRIVGIFGDDFSRRLPGAEQVSRQLGMSVSTLRRQLLEEGTSFQRLKDESRQAAAMQYLATSELTYTEIAGLLGFDEASAFFRAFKRWTGTTPSGYRASL